jgi:hypothetical protein
MPTPASNIRYFRRGISKAYFVPTIAAQAAPTAAEVTAGQNLTTDLADLTGFTFTNEPIAVPDWSDNFDSKIPGVDTTSDGTLTFYERALTNPLRTTLGKGVSGYVVIFYAGTAGATPAALDKCEVWPTTFTGAARDYSSGAEGAKWHTSAVPTARPSVDAVMA